jgi:hypothetical protein
MRSLLVLPAVIPVIALAGCSLSDDGERTTQTRDVTAFTRVDNDDSVRVVVHAGSPHRVRVRAGDKVIDDVRTVVRDGTLRVTFDHDSWGDPDVVVEAWTPRLTAIHSDGSGDVEADGVDGDAFEVTADGSADVRVRGRADRLVVSADGSGNAKLADLETDEARVTASGSGDVEIRATTRLAVNVDGSGNVRYHGKPQLTQQDEGSGDVQRAD